VRAGVCYLNGTRPFDIGSTLDCAARIHRAHLFRHENECHAQADLLCEARVVVVVAEEGRSISALLTDRLEAIVRERKAFDKARRRQQFQNQARPSAGRITP
jgi:hypothetical protein